MMADHLSQPEYQYIHKISLLKSYQNSNNQSKSDNQSNSNNQSNIDDQSKSDNQSNSDQSSIEKSISQNLDFYIEKYPNELFSIPITSLYNIFYNESRVITDCKKAYELILKKLVNDKNLSVLLGSFKAENLSEELVIDSAIKINEHNGFYPQVTSNFINSIVKFKKEKNELNNSLIQMTKNYEMKEKQLKENQLNYENELKKQKEDYENQIKQNQLNRVNELKKQKEDFENRIKQIQLSHNNELKKQKEYYENQIKQIQLNRDNELKKQKENYENQIKQIQLNRDNELKKQKEDHESLIKQTKDKNIVIQNAGNKKLFNSQKIDFSKSVINNKSNISKSQDQMFSQTMKSIQLKQKQTVDILFIVDGSNSTQENFDLYNGKLIELAFDFVKSNRNSSNKMGMILYQDPIENKGSPVPQKRIDFCEFSEFSNFIDDLTHVDNIKIKPLDYFEAFDTALNHVQWRKGLKTIVCISSSSFYMNNKTESEMFEKIAKFATQNFYFIGLYCNSNAYQTFCYMKNIYDRKGGPLFYIDDINNNLLLNDLINPSETIQPQFDF